MQNRKSASAQQVQENRCKSEVKIAEQRVQVVKQSWTLQTNLRLRRELAISRYPTGPWVKQLFIRDMELEGGQCWQIVTLM